MNPPQVLLQALLQDLPRPIGGIAHIGAGQGNELPIYLQSGSLSVLLVDADPDQISELNAACDEPRVSIVQAALSGDQSPRPFFRFSQPEMNSLRAPTELTILFPGLRILSQDPMTPQDPAEFLTQWLPPKGSTVLVLEVPGEALGILQSLTDADVLHRFSAIILSESPDPLYQSAAPLGRIRDYLSASGFGVTGAADPERPEHPWLFARLDTAALAARDVSDKAIAELREKLATAVKQSEKDASALQEARQKMDHMHAEILKAEGQIQILSELFRGRKDA